MPDLETPQDIDLNIPLEFIQDEFKSSLVEPLNKRIFFNGQYGAGKTHFLNKFFEQNSSDYEVFHLFPVYYQVHDNKDIADLIKYDLLIELQKRNPKIFEYKEGATFTEELEVIINELKKDEYIKSILKKIFNITTSAGEISGVLPPSLSSILGKGVDTLFRFDEKIQKIVREKVAIQDGFIVEEFINKIKSLNLGVSDYLDLIILDAILEIKGDKKSVLIIDDLDRLDPEHLFRILNIFSSHFDLNDNNKYNFDFVVIVGDRDNVKSIFKHKYGENTDFDGYFDKFFSTTPFVFDNKKAIISTISQIVRSINFGDETIKKSLEGGDLNIIFEILNKSIVLNFINLRSLLKATKITLSSVKGGSYDNVMGSSGNNHYRAILKIATRLLIDILDGDKNKLINLVKDTISKKSFEPFILNRRNNHYEDLNYTMLKEFDPYVDDGEGFELGDSEEDRIAYTIDSPKVHPIAAQRDREVELFYRIFFRYLEKISL